MSKKLLLGKHAINQLLNGVNKLNDSVKVTLGAKGKTVIIGKINGNAPHITKDGVTVSESLELEDPIENLGASIIKQVAAKTAHLAGDGTSTATILAHAIVTNGLKAIANGANAMDVKRGIEQAVNVIVMHLKTLSKPVSTPELFKQIAIISANGDTELGSLIAAAFDKVGSDGMITVEESKGYDTSMFIVDGMQVDSGYLSPYLVTDSARKVCEFVNPMIILISESVAMMSTIIPMLNKIVEDAKSKQAQGPLRPIIFIAENIKDEALATLVVNHVQNIMPCCAIKAPSYGSLKKAIMEDIAVFTGAKYILEEKGLRLESAGVDCIGSAERVVVEENKTMIYFGKGDKIALETYCADLRKQIIEETNERAKNTIKARLARLVNGVAVINVGGATEIEVLEKKDRIDDAIRAVRAASEEGFVAGGGTTLVHCSKILHDVIGENKSQTIGIQVVRKALQAPFLQIMTNAGLLNQSGSFFSNRRNKKMLDKVMDSEYGHGMNVKTDIFEDLLFSGVIDPTKVSRVALENAASAAGIFLTTECVLNENPK